MSDAAKTIPSAAPAPGGMKAQVMSALRWSAVAKFGGQIVNWAITLFVIRLLVPADYGLVAMIGIIFMFMGMLGEMGFGSSIAQSKELDEQEIRQTFGAALIVNLSICAILVLAAPAIAAFYHEPRLVDMTRVAALSFIGAGFTPVYSGLLQRDMNYKTLARIDIVSGVLTNGVTLTLAWLGFGAWALVLGGLIASPVRVAMTIAACPRFYWPSFGIKGTRRLWTFGGSVLGTRVVWYWSSQADVLIAGKFLGPQALGLYSVAVHLASLPMQRAAGIINGVAFTAFAKIQHDPRAVAFNTRLGVRLMAFVTFPVLWGIGAVAPELVELVIGPTWLASVLPLTLISLTIPFRMIGSIVSTTIMSMGRVHVAMWTTIIGACIAPPLFYIGSRYGILGLSEAWLVVTPVLFLLNMFRTLPILGVSARDIASEIWRPMSIAACMFAGAWGMRMAAAGLPNAVLLVLLIATGATIYLIGSWAFNRTTTIEVLSLLFPRWAPRFAQARAEQPVPAG